MEAHGWGHGCDLYGPAEYPRPSGLGWFRFSVSFLILYSATNTMFEVVSIKSILLEKMKLFGKYGHWSKTLSCNLHTSIAGICGCPTPPDMGFDPSPYGIRWSKQTEGGHVPAWNWIFPRRISTLALHDQRLLGGQLFDLRTFSSFFCWWCHLFISNNAQSGNLR